MPFIAVTTEFGAGLIIATDGPVVSAALMVYVWMTTLALFPAASFAKYFNVVVEVIEIGEL
jgi:hypothetical protein